MENDREQKIKSKNKTLELATFRKQLKCLISRFVRALGSARNDRQRCSDNS